MLLNSFKIIEISIDLLYHQTEIALIEEIFKK